MQTGGGRLACDAAGTERLFPGGGHGVRGIAVHDGDLRSGSYTKVRRSEGEVLDHEARRSGAATDCRRRRAGRGRAIVTAANRAADQSGAT
jgi:hypothetical protein